MQIRKAIMAMVHKALPAHQTTRTAGGNLWPSQERAVTHSQEATLPLADRQAFETLAASCEARRQDRNEPLFLNVPAV